MTHTPGPWHLRPCMADNVNGGEYRPIVANPSWIADVRCNSDEDEDNARLIAAAPELLEACKAMRLAMRAVSRTVKDFSRELDMARAAIAKATGS